MSQQQEYLKRVNAALALRDIPDFPAALDQLNKAKLLDPEDASVYLLLGLTFQDLGELVNAENSLQRAFELDSDSLEIKQTYGILLSRIQKDQDAIRLLQPLFEIDPKNSVISRALASSLHREKKGEEAIRILENNFIHSNDIEVVFDLIDLLETKREYDKAEKILKDLLENKLSSKVLSRLGNLNLIQQNYEEASRIFEKAICLNVEDKSAWIGLIRVHIEQGNLGRAFEVVLSGTSKLSDSRNLFQLKGEILFLMNKNNEALQAYNHAIDMSKATGEINDTALLLYIRDRKVFSNVGSAEALALVEEDIKSTKGFPPLVSLKTRILLNQKKFKQAVKFIKSLDKQKYEELIFPYHYQALINLHGYEEASELLAKAFENSNIKNKNDLIESIELEGVNQYISGEIEQSGKVFEHVLKLIPERPRALNNLGFIYLSQHKWDYALDLLDQAQMNNFPNMDVLLTNRGYIYLCKGEYETAIAILQDALSYLENFEEEAYLHVAFAIGSKLQLNPQDDYPERLISIRLAIHANLATAHYLKGEIEKAHIYANEVVDINSNDNIGYRLLGNLHYSEAHFELAKKLWNKALRSEKSKKEAKVIKSLIAILSNQNVKLS